ncbi:MAG: thioredoxin domain-containing protein [Gammaproteobacteria bacterium]|nr:MAG: thioredoxin domain-containing protein [Gammaproteobacteria bacterium]
MNRRRARWRLRLPRFPWRRAVPCPAGGWGACVGWLLLGILWWPLAAGANALAGHPSPYLAMHGRDPIDWQPFGAAALERARRTGRLIFVSSGYYACHWCHVMHRESFLDPEVARVLNAGYVAIKVDRELSPALDGTLVAFVEKTRGRAGWPLQVILTPEGEPLVGFTYLPRDRLLSVLKRMQAEWRRRPEDLRRLAHRQVADLQPAVAPAARLPRYETLRKRLLKDAMLLGDEFSGGFGRESRFPMSPQLDVLVRLVKETNAPWNEKHLRVTLEQMAGLGLHDHLRGGFFRYTVDPEWQQPHFEKMLYDNAQLAALYLRAGRRWQRADWRAVGRETLDFLLRAMAHPEGGFVASLSAVDDQGHEGGCYLWSEAQLRRVLGEKGLAQARRLFRLTPADRLPGGWLIVPADRRPDPARARLLERLRRARADCRMPVDGKRLASWNALALEALCEGAREPGGARYRQAARAQFAFMRRHFLLPDGRLVRARRGERVLAEAGLEDYGLFARALARCGPVLPRGKPLARTLVARAWKRFFTPRGWRNPVRRWLAWAPEYPAEPDDVLPSPSAALVEATRALGVQAPVRQALLLAAPVVEDAPFWYASHVPLYAAVSVGQGDP